MNYKNVLIAFAQLEKDVPLIQKGLDIAQKYSGSATVIHINTEMAGKPSPIRGPFEHKCTEEEIKDVIAKNNPGNVPTQILIKTSNNIISEITKVSQNFDLLVIGHEHMNFLVSAISDSIDEHIVNQVHCDSLVVQI